jgi:hypothetical protein
MVRIHRPPLAALGTPRCRHRMSYVRTRSPHRTTAVRTSRPALVTGQQWCPWPLQQQARTQRCTLNYPSIITSLLFFIIGWDCVALSYVAISISIPPMDEVAVACPLGHNNNDTRGRAIYVGAVVDSGDGTTHACSSSSGKPCLLTSGYRPRVLSGQSLSRSSFLFFLFSVGHNMKDQRRRPEGVNESQSKFFKRT